MFEIFVLIGFIGHCACVVNQSPGVPSQWGPYPESAHTPATVYGPPPTPNPQPAVEYGAPPPPSPSTTVQVSLENLQYAGQVVEVNAPSHRPSHVYLSPKPSNQFAQLKKPTPSTKVFLPKENPPKPFHSTSLNTGELFVNTQQFGQLSQQPSTFFASNQHLPQIQEIRQFRPIAQQVPANEYGAPPLPPSNLNPYPYPPQPVAPLPPPPPVHETANEIPLAHGDDDDDDDDNANDDPTVIAVANASGQYYILGKDNTLQRVVYRTEQTKDDSIKNGFTAHLRYSLVAPIRDPIYGYDDQGHLVRIYNKK